MFSDSTFSDNIEESLFKIHHNIRNVKHVTICSWVYYNKNNDLCILLNEKKNFTVKNKLIKSNVYFVKLIDQYKLENICINDVENEIKYIETSSILFNSSNEIVKYISKEIGDNYSFNTFECTWLIDNCMKITIDLYKFIIKLTIGEYKEISISPRKLKIFLDLNISKITQVITQNKKNQKVKIDLNKKLDLEKKLLIKKNDDLISYDSTKKIGSKLKNSDIYTNKSLKERYEVQAQKPFITNYEWTNL